MVTGLVMMRVKATNKKRKTATEPALKNVPQENLPQAQS
jgi:hypothetical protein